MENQKTATIPAEVAKAIKALFTFADKSREQMLKLAQVIFTPEIMADPKAYKTARGQCQLWLVQTRGLEIESARTEVYRVLRFVGLNAPGKNAGAANGKAKETSATEAEADAIVAVGPANAEKALVAAFRAKDYGKCIRIIDATKRADAAAKAKDDAAKAKTVAEADSADNA